MIKSWEEVSDQAEQLFDIWEARRELQWAKNPRGILEAQGLTSYSNDLEEHRGLLRLLALAAMYADFSYLAYDEDPRRSGSG